MDKGKLNFRFFLKLQSHYIHIMKLIFKIKKIKFQAKQIMYQ